MSPPASKILTRGSFRAPARFSALPAHEIVVDDDLTDVLARQEVDRVRADQAGTADDDQPLTSNVHVIFVSDDRGYAARLDDMRRWGWSQLLPTEGVATRDPGSQVQCSRSRQARG